MKHPIFFHSEGVPFQLRDRTHVRSWLANACVLEAKSLGDVNYVFCSDEHLYEMNVQYLNHDTLTDVITFDYTTPEEISGDIYISIDRVRENARKYRFKVADELHRVMVHGLLHLLGYKDKQPAEQAQMTEKEDYYLSLRSFSKD